MLLHPINIAFCVNDKYIKYITVTIKSIIENENEDVYIHVLTDHISNKSRENLLNVIEGYDNISLHIYEVDDTLLRTLKTDYWTIYTWYRLLIPQVLPNTIERVLYLDADTLVTSNLHELFSIDMRNKSIAASLDVQSLDKLTFDRCGYDMSLKYICAGVLLINLDYWRKYYLSEQIFNWAKLNHDRIKFPDQDAINYLCKDTKIILPMRYGILNAYFTNESFYNKDYVEQLNDCINHPSIIHYAACPPWIKERAKHIMQGEWVRINKMMPKPVKCFYESKGIVFIKVFIWRLLYSFKRNDKNRILENIRQKLLKI